MEKVNVYAKTAAGRWELIFKDILEDQAREIWLAGFKTGLNRISIDTEIGRDIVKRNLREAGQRV